MTVKDSIKYKGRGAVKQIIKDYLKEKRRKEVTPGLKGGMAGELGRNLSAGIHVIKRHGLTRENQRIIKKGWEGVIGKGIISTGIKGFRRVLEKR